MAHTLLTDESSPLPGMTRPLVQALDSTLSQRCSSKPEARQRSSSTILLALLVASSPAPAFGIEGSTGSLRGTVVAAEDGRPLRGVTIATEEAMVVTDPAGRFRIDDLAPGDVAVSVRAPGFLEETVSPVSIAPGKATTLEVALEATPDFMERIQVTATKEPMRIGEITAQADIVDRSQIERRGDLQLTQAIRNLPGLVVSTQAGSFESVLLRGLPRDGNEFTTTLLLVDGIPQTDSRNSARVVNLPIHDAASIEVVRGPSSALYGRTAIGGAINVLTAEPTAEHRAAIDLTGGDFATLKGVASVSGPLSQRTGYYVSGAAETNDGYFSGPAEYEVDEQAVFAKLSFGPDSRSFGFATLNRVRSDNSTPTNVPIIGGRLLSDIDPRFDRFTNLNLPGPNYHQEEDRLAARYTRQLGASTSLVGLAGFREIQYKFIDDGDVIGGPFDLAATTLTMFPFDLQTDEDIFYSELRFELSPGAATGEDSLLAGGSYESTTGFSSGNLIFTDPETFGMPIDYLGGTPPPRSEWQFFPFGGSDYDLEVTGLFAQYRRDLSRRWLLTAGGRYDRLELDNVLTRRTLRPRVSDTFDAFSPKLGVTYRALGGAADGPVLNVYASYSEAFQPPRRPSQLQPSDEEIELSPEDIENVEAGVKGSVLSGRLSFQGAYFHTRRQGLVTTVRQGPFFRPTNAGEHVYRGFEGAARWTATRGVETYLNASFYRNRFGHFVIESPAGDTVLTGNRLPIAPDRIFNGGIRIAAARPFDIVVDVKHVGDVAVDQGNTFELEPYTLVDAAVSWQREPLRVTLAAHNLLDEEYFWNGDTSRAESADPGAPRQVLLTTAIQLR